MPNWNACLGMILPILPGKIFLLYFTTSVYRLKSIMYILAWNFSLTEYLYKYLN